MDLKTLVIVALQISIFCTVLGFGLRTTVSDLLYLIHRPGLLMRSLLAVFVVMPVVAIALARLFNFLQVVEIALIALAISPVPPLLPKKASQAGGNQPYALGLLALLSLVAIVFVPLVMEVLSRAFGERVAMAPWTIARAVLMSALLPLAIGMMVRAVRPALARRIEKPLELIAKVLLPLAAVVLLVSAASSIWALIRQGTVIAIATFLAAGLGVGHILGGPNPDHQEVLAVSTANRHPAIAFSIAVTNYPGQNFGAAILLYLILGGIIGIPYLAWQRRRAAGTTSTEARPSKGTSAV